MKSISSPILQSLLITGICILSFAVGPSSCFETNDDVYYSLIMSGKLLTNTPDAHVVLINIILAAFFSKLYTILPSIPWFGYFQVGSLLFSTFFINYIFSLTRNCEMFIARLIASLFFTLPFLCYIQFTKTSLVLGLTGYFAFYMLTVNSNDEEKGINVYLYIMSFILLLLSFYLRKESFFLATMLSSFFMIKTVFRCSKRCKIIMVAGSLIIITSTLVHKVSYDSSWHNLFSLQKAASAILDYDKIAYNYNVFNKAGLSLNDFLMLKIWAYSDTKIFNKERLDYIYENSLKSANSINIKAAYNDAISFPATNYIVAALAFSLGILFLYKQNLRDLLLYIVLPLIICVLLLLIQGRFPTRISTSLAFFLPWGYIVFSTTMRKKPAQLLISACIIFYSVFTTYKHIKDISYLSNNAAKQNKELRSLGQIAQNFPITLVTVGATFPYEGILPFETPTYLSRIHFIWLCGMNQSPLQKKQIALSGSNDLFDSLATNGNFYVSFDPSTANIFQRYYMEHYNIKIGIEAAHISNSFGVYKIKPDNKKL